MAAVVSVLVIILLSLLITRFATMTLEVTGMSRESARFQARSALTGSGFTTSESESVVNHPLRRRVIMRLMLTGSAGVVTVIASLILSFRHGGISTQAIRGGVLVGGLAALWWLSRLDVVDRRLTRLIARFLRARGFEARDYARLLDLSGDYAVSELKVEPGDWVAGRSLRSLRLRDEGVVVLGIRRGGRYIGVPRPETGIEAGDTLILYGTAERVADLDDRATGPEGEERHRRACATHTGAAEPDLVPAAER